MLLKVKLLRQETGCNTIKPIRSKYAAIHIICSPTGKVAFMRSFQKLKASVPFDTELRILNTKTPFLITVDASFIEIGAALFQLNKKKTK